ncbi:CarD family transcriptional regulator [Oceanobacillus sp. Castelsardo]|uniref:CarD family transcriptional regulator n=1 Tax=Oceanobacillus sp. Castelsardo TaxID=1851204 RepID=UPI000837FA58|nr:CarD family transcriptional regulator [Oceanobacillus sp. Castelsardo]
MFKIGEMVIYSVHGVCVIDDICERTFRGETKSYYVMHPKNDSSLIINVPVDNEKVSMLKTLEKEEAKELLQTFNEPGISWVQDVRLRYKKYSKLIQSGNRSDICNVVNTLMRKQNDAEKENKKLSVQDLKLLENIQDILFNDLALALDTTPEKISKKVHQIIQ